MTFLAESFVPSHVLKPPTTFSREHFWRIYSGLLPQGGCQANDPGNNLDISSPYQEVRQILVRSVLTVPTPQHESIPSSITAPKKNTQKKRRTKTMTKTTPEAGSPISTAPAKETKQPKPAPLPATVQVRGLEITIPSTKACWRVSVLHRCGHPVMETSPAPYRYPGCDKPLVVEVNRHMRRCGEKCKVERMDHFVQGWCGCCQLLGSEEAGCGNT